MLVLAPNAIQSRVRTASSSSFAVGVFIVCLQSSFQVGPLGRVQMLESGLQRGRVDIEQFGDMAEIVGLDHRLAKVTDIDQAEGRHLLNGQLFPRHQRWLVQNWTPLNMYYLVNESAALNHQRLVRIDRDRQRGPMGFAQSSSRERSMYERPPLRHFDTPHAGHDDRQA